MPQPTAPRGALRIIQPLCTGTLYRPRCARGPTAALYRCTVPLHRTTPRCARGPTAARLYATARGGSRAVYCTLHCTAALYRCTVPLHRTAPRCARGPAAARLYAAALGGSVRCIARCTAALYRALPCTRPVARLYATARAAPHRGILGRLPPSRAAVCRSTTSLCIFVLQIHSLLTAFVLALWPAAGSGARLRDLVGSFLLWPVAPDASRQ